jgi:predicted small secreted protein
MRKTHLAVILVSLAALFLSACGQTKVSASNTVQDYLSALVAKDANRLSTLSCGEWESKALLELDSFQAVATRLEGLTCNVSGTDGTTVLVNCQGKIMATYNNEDQEFDLSVRTYQVVQQGGEYLVCGYR